MSFFAIRYPFFILMACMIVVVVGVAAITGMPVDLFPPINIPVVLVATFYADHEHHTPGERGVYPCRDVARCRRGRVSRILRR